MRRTQIYLDESQAHELTRRAAVRRTTMSKVIREAIDEYLADPEDERAQLERFRAAVDAVFGIAPYLPPGDQYVEELRKVDAAREADLERRWRR